MCVAIDPNHLLRNLPRPDPTDEQRHAIAAAAKELDRLRNNRLNPPEWTRTAVLEFPGTADGPWRRYVDVGTANASRGVHPHGSATPAGVNPAARGAVGTVRYPRVVPRDEDCAKQLKKRTLTNLYNERPTWLDLAHRRLDAAVFAAYGWDPGLSDDELLAKLLELNLRESNAENLPIRR